jgi:hypothetical protein
MKRLLIITGPQGSGNHMWSKVLAHSPSVQGWQNLTKEYWISHKDEPMNHIWQDPSLFTTTEFPYDNYVTSISNPFTRMGPKDSEGWQTPKYDEFIQNAQQAGFNVKLAILGRDQNILEFQQTRVRGKYSTPLFLKEMSTLMKYNPVFLSNELLHLYGIEYLNQMSKLLDFPIEIDDATLKDILKENANKKYLKPVDDYWLDEVMYKMARDQQ